MPNILYIANGRSFYSSNPPRKIEKVVDAFRSLGHEVHFLAGGDLVKSKPPQFGGGRIEREKKTSSLKRYIRHSVSEIRDCLHDRKLFKTIKREYGSRNIDLVWERSSRLHLAGLKFAKEKKLLYVMEWKDNLVRYDYSLLKRFALHMEQKKIQQADTIVVESLMLAKQIARENGLPENKFKVAFNAVDAEQFYRPELRTDMRKKLGLSEEQFVVGYVGSYAFYHNVHILCDAVNELLRQNKARNLKIVLVGDGSGRHKLEKRAKDLSVESYFKVVGNVHKDEVPGYLSAFDCAILPDSTEIICPVKVQEYMAAELPVLLPNYEANREIITQEIDGLLFQAKSYKAIAEGISRLYEDRDLALRLGKSARAVAVRELSWAATWGTALDEVLK